MPIENQPISMMDILIETHAGLTRQGPGSPEMTLKALRFLDHLDSSSKIADLGCGTGGPSMVLAQNIAGSIVGVDQVAVFIDIFNDNAKKRHLGERAAGIVGDIIKLPFEKEEFDLIWSEGAIDNVGFEKGLIHWNGFLKKGGYVAVTCPSWLTNKRPTEVDTFWTDAGSGLDSVEHNIEVVQKSGFSFIAAFALPETCWTDHYFTPREAAEKAFMEKYPKNKTVEEYMASSRYEVDLYSKYKQYYGYVFYIGRKGI